MTERGGTVATSIEMTSVETRKPIVAGMEANEFEMSMEQKLADG